MYEIFGSDGLVSVKKNTSIKHTGVFGSVKGDVNKKRSISVGSSKKVLGDVSNKVKNTLQPEPRLHSQSLSSCKSSKKLLFPIDSVAPEEDPQKICISQLLKRSKSPAKRIPLSPKYDNGIAKCMVQPIKRSKSPVNVTPVLQTFNNRLAKIPIFVESDSENEIDVEENIMSHQLDDVFASPIIDGGQACNFLEQDESPQAIHGYCSGYDTPEEDSDGWLVEPLWANKKELQRITHFHLSLESVKELSDNEELAVKNQIFDENLLVDDTSYIPLSDDVPIPDMEW